MSNIHRLLSIQLPPEGYPSEIAAGSPFIRFLTSPVALWAVRILLAAALLTVFLGIWHCDRREKRLAAEWESAVSDEKGEAD